MTELNKKLDDINNNVTDLSNIVDNINKIVDTTNKYVSLNKLYIYNTNPEDSSVYIKNYHGSLTIYQTDGKDKRHYTKLINTKNINSHYNPDEYGYWYMSAPL